MFPNSKRFVFGMKKDMKELTSELEDDKYNSFILFPSKDSAFVSDWLEQKYGGVTTNPIPELNSMDLTLTSSSKGGFLPAKKDIKPLHVCILDATWRQAQTFKQAIPRHNPTIKD